jgi:hypothetical protein
MAKRCDLCSNAAFRLSKLRFEDVFRLVLLMYPVRCMECYRRSSVFLLMAPLYRNPASVGQETKEQKA